MRVGLRVPIRRSTTGVAIIIVLVFVVMLTGLVVAFFSRALSDRQVSNSSANATKVELFAQGAADQIVGDLKQEIVAGSTLFGTVCTPTTAANAMPALVGSTGSNGLENLLKVSLRASTAYSGGPLRAAAVSSTTASLNGRYLSTARWNKPLFLPVTSSSNTSPNLISGTFPAPDWIFISRDGSNPTAWNANLKTSGTNSTTVVGRYAYAIYHEGGLLDANAVGIHYVSNSIAYSETAYKDAQAFIDLGQLKDPTTGAAFLSKTVISQLVSWRNWSSTLASGSFSSPTFPSNSGTNYANYVLSNSTGFLRVSGTLNNGQSDRMFASRQQLIDFVENGLHATTAVTGSNINVLNYLTHFSRDLNQPSFAPDTTRPLIIPLTAGGNDAYSKDNTVNPSFLSVQVNSPFTRNDGSTAIVGEPLVKKRFPLNHLAWLTYKGPSNGRSLSDTDIATLTGTYGISSQFLAQGTDQKIQQYFGLRWNAKGWWEYNVHTSGAIKTLSEVAAENREPDFVELLKASITAGALGKSGAQGSSPNPAYIQYIRDSTLDFQVIQITANIIDQFDVDGYPTRIQYSGREIRGVENLPYLYRVRNGLYTIINPNPMPPPGSGYTQFPNDFSSMSPATLSDQGTFIMVQQPEIWNPNAYNATSPTTINRSMGNPRPSNLQLVVYGGPPVLPPAVPDSGGALSVAPHWETGNVVSSLTSDPLSENTTKMTFTNGEKLYREPTLLIKPTIPAGSNLQAPGFVTAVTKDGLSSSNGGIAVLNSLATAYAAGNGQEPSPTGIYCGIYLGKNVIAWAGKSPDGATDGTRIANGAGYTGSPNLTYQLQCDSATGSGMDIYDEKYFQIDSYTDIMPDTVGVYGYSILCLNSNAANNAGTYKGRLLIGANHIMTCFDPRTSHFGFMRSQTGDATDYQDKEFAIPGDRSPNSPKWVDQMNNVVPSNRFDTSAGFGFSAPSNAPPASSSGWNWDNQLLRFGLFSQNSFSFQNDNLRFIGDPHTNNMGAPAPQYYSDCDGVVRRAMGGHFAPGTAAGLPMSTAYYAASDSRQQESRPIILNRPFRTIGELGYVFSDTPWKNLDFSTPESGFAPLLDVFCINDTENADGMVAGKVNLNTRQSPVIQAIVSGAYKDEYGSASASPISTTDAATIAGVLTTRTNPTSAKGPLLNIADLVGRWKGSSTTAPVDGSANYDGFSADLSISDSYSNNISRYRESAIRALASTGNTRVWNLMIDVVAQTGRFPQSASKLENFSVEGEQRYWVHVAIDRYTGKVIDKQIEVVKE
jgi:Tfp pilus assembly protein PilX